MSPVPRRTLLRAAAAGSIGPLVAGCSRLERETQFEAAHETHLPASATAEWDASAGPPLQTNLFVDRDRFERTVRFDRLSDLFVADLDVDFASQFVTTFQTRFDLYPPDVSLGGCPEPRHDDGTVTYRVPLATWPAEGRGRTRVLFRLTVWRMGANGPPDEVGAELLLGDSATVPGCGAGDGGRVERP